MKTYEEPIINIIFFETLDIISTSGNDDDIDDLDTGDWDEV